MAFFLPIVLLPSILLQAFQSVCYLPCYFLPQVAAANSLPLEGFGSVP